MRLSKSDRIAGYPMTTIRQLMRDCAYKEWITPKGTASLLNISVDNATQLLNALIHEDLLTKIDGPDCLEVTWSTTVKGHALAQAHFLPAITRAKADIIVHQLLERVRQSHHDPYYFLCVQSLHVFGSYANTVPTVNDIDLILTLGWKPQFTNPLIRSELSQARRHQASRNGRRFRHLSDELNWPDTELKRFLRARNPRISFHADDEAELLNVSLTELYRCPS